MLQAASFLSALCLLVASNPTGALTPDRKNATGEVADLISWLLEDGRDLSRIAFSEVVEETTGKSVFPVDLKSEQDREVIQKITEAAEALLAEINSPDHPIHQVGRINEVSGHLEDVFLKKLNAIDGLVCTYPLTSDGRTQRSGYPDLRLLDEASGRILYIDPKLYAAGSERSTFRTFYFEPKTGTNKILDDASHLIVGIAHGGRGDDGNWTFLRWNWSISTTSKCA